MKLKFVFDQQYQLCAIDTVRCVFVKQQLNKADFGERKVVESGRLNEVAGMTV